jgi:Fe-S cluster assembly iron-binding protein IscA
LNPSALSALEHFHAKRDPTVAMLSIVVQKPGCAQWWWMDEQMVK